MSENEIRSYLDSILEKYNGKVDNVGLLYHVEVTRLDYGVVVFATIKRDDFYIKKFVFRFRKDIQTGLGNLTSAGMLKPKTTDGLIDDLIGVDNNE